MKNYKPNVNEFVDILGKYSGNKRVMSVNIIQNIQRKNPLYRLMRLEILPEKNTIDSIDLNRFLKTLIILTSDQTFNIGDYNEYIRYKEIYDKINNDLISSTHDKKINEVMLKQAEEKMKEYSIENEFKDNKILHNYLKKILMYLSTNSLDSNDFYKEIVIKMKNKKSGLYAPPSLPKYNAYNKDYRAVKDYHRQELYSKCNNEIDNYVNIKDVTINPSIDTTSIDFPPLSETSSKIELRHSQSCNLPRVWSDVVRVTHNSSEGQLCNIANNENAWQ